MTKNLFEISFDHKGFNIGDAKNLVDLLKKSSDQSEVLKENIENISLSKPVADASKLKETIIQLAKSSDIKLDLKELDKSFQNIEGKIPEIKSFLQQLKSEFKNIDDPNTLKQLQKSINLVENSLKDFENKSKSSSKTTQTLNKDLHRLDATFEDIYGDLKPMTGRIGELEDRMYELSLAGRSTTSEYKALEDELVKLKKTIYQVDQSVDASFENNRNLVATAEGVNLLISGFQVYEGVMASVGVESEDLQETMTRLIAIQNVANGVQEINNVLIKNSATFTRVATSVNQLFSRSNIFVAETTGLATASQKAFNKALITSGIGALIIGLGLLIANFDEISNAISGTTKVMNQVNEATKEASSVMVEAKTKVYEVGAAFEGAKKGTISKKEALEVYNKTLGDTIGEAETLEEAERLYIENTGAYLNAVKNREIAQILFKQAAEKSVEVELNKVRNEQGEFTGKFKENLLDIFKGVRFSGISQISAQKRKC